MVVAFYFLFFEVSRKFSKEFQWKICFKHSSIRTLLLERKDCLKFFKKTWSPFALFWGGWHCLSTLKKKNIISLDNQKPLFKTKKEFNLIGTWQWIDHQSMSEMQHILYFDLDRTIRLYNFKPNYQQVETYNIPSYLVK